MKVRWSKRLLSAFLAVLMIVTSIPMMSLTALADEFKPAVLFYDFCGGNSATYDNNEVGRVIDVSKHTKSINDYTPVASSTGYTISFSYNPLNLNTPADKEKGTESIINIGTSSTASRARTYFNLYEDGQLHWTWDVDGGHGNNYFDAVNVFGDKLTANAWHEIIIVVTPVLNENNESYDIIKFYVDNVLTKTIDLSQTTNEAMGVTESSLYPGKCVSAYLAEERPVFYGASVEYGNWGDAIDGYIDNVIIRNNAHATIDMLKEKMTEYENAMLDNTVYMNMRAAYQAYVDGNKVYDAYYYGGNKDNVVTQDNITRAYWRMRLTLGNMTKNPWDENKATATASAGIRINNGDKSLSGTESQYWNNLLWAANAENDTASADLTSWISSNNKAIKTWIRTPEVTMMYCGVKGHEPKAPVMICINRTNKTRYVGAISLSSNNNDLSLTGNWKGQLNNNNNWNFTAAMNNGDVTSGSTAKDDWMPFELTENTNTGFANLMTFSGTFDEDEYIRNDTITIIPRITSGTTYNIGDIAPVLTSSAPVHVVNYKVVLDYIDQNKNRLKTVKEYRQGGAEGFLSGFDRLLYNPSSFFVNVTNSKENNDAMTAYEKHYKDAFALVKAGSTKIESNYQKIRAALENPVFNPDSKEEVSPMQRVAETGQGSFDGDLWEAFMEAYNAAQDAMIAPFTSDKYVAVDASIATNLTNTFTALRYPEMAYTEPVVLPEMSALGPDTKVTITSQQELDASAQIKYKVVYDGESQVKLGDMLKADVSTYTGEFAPFAGSSDHSAVTIYACIVKDGATVSPMSITNYYIFKGPDMSVATGTAIAPDAQITLSPAPDNGGTVYDGAVEYCINDGEWTAYVDAITPFEGTYAAEVTIQARQLVLIDEEKGETITSAISSATYVRATSSDLAITSELGNKVNNTSTIKITDPENIDTTIKYSMNVNGVEKATGATYSAPIALTDLGNIEYIIVNAWREYQGEATAVKKIFLNDSLDTLALRESFDNVSINGNTLSSTPTLGGTYDGKFTSASGSVVAGAGHISGQANGYNYADSWRENVLKINATTDKTQHLEIPNPLANVEANKVAAQSNGITLSYWRYVENAGKVVDDITAFTGNDGWYTGVGFKNAATDSSKTSTEYFLSNMNGFATFRQEYSNSAGMRYQDFKPNPQDKTLHAAGNYNGQWMNIVVTVDPNAESNNVKIYTNGVPHVYDSVPGDFGNSKMLAQNILDFVTKEGTVITIGDGGLGDATNNYRGYWANGYDTYVDDVRVYTEVLTQVDINNMYVDEYADCWSEKAFAHDPTAVTVYTLADGRTVGQEYMDKYPNTEYTKMDYYMFGTGMTVYHSDDAYIWKAIGDDEGRFGYQNQKLFGKAYTTALAGPLGYTASSPENIPGAGFLVWAPHVMYNTTIKKWCYYGSTSAWGAKQSEIFMGTSDNITGPYTNITTIARSEANVDKVNAIDPATFYSQDGTLYMVYGSYQTGIAIKKLNADGTCIGGSSKYVADLNSSLDAGGAKMITLSAGIGSGEGPFIKYQNGYYYLYVAYGANGWTYTTRVFRSENPEGPYKGINGIFATDPVNDNEKRHGNQFMSSYLIQGNSWVNSGTGHNSLFNVQNDKDEIVTLNAVHSRPLATSQTDKMNASEDGVLATRQSGGLSGNNTVLNLVGYTESGWPVSFPLKYNGTDSLKLGNVTAHDLAGIYAGNKFDVGLAGYQYNGLYTFRLIPETNTTGVLYGTEYNGTLFTFNFEIFNVNNNSWVRFKNSEGKVVREAAVATQVKDGKTVYELGIINCDSTSESFGKQIWCYKGQELPSPDDVESNTLAVDMDQIIYTHKANAEYYKYGQEISDRLDYDSRTNNYGERATKIRIKYPYTIDTSDPGAVYCYSDESICSEYGCSGSGLYAELVKAATKEGEYSEYILRGYVSDYFKYNADTESYTEDGVILIIRYKDADGAEHSEFAFAYVMPNPSIAHTVQFIRNEQVAAFDVNNRKISTGLYTRFIGSEGTATDIISTQTKWSNYNINTKDTEPKVKHGTGVFKQQANWGDAASTNDDIYRTPSLIQNQFDDIDKSVGVNSGSFGAVEHEDTNNGSIHNTSNVVMADYYLDYSNPDNPIINRDASGKPTGYSITFKASNLKWKPGTDSKYGTSFIYNTTGLNTSIAYSGNVTTHKVDTTFSSKYYSDVSKNVMNGTYAGTNVGLTSAFAEVPITASTTNSWNGTIILTGKDSLEKNPLVDPATDQYAAEKSANFILEQGLATDNLNPDAAGFWNSEEIYSYYNVGVSTCDKGAVREFVESFANKKLNIVRNKATGRIESIVADGDLVGSDYSAASYREYMRALSEGYFFVENMKNTRYEENGVEKAYTTAYGTTPDGSTHSFIYTDEEGNNIFGDAKTYTDPVQAQIIENIIDKYEALFTIEKFNQSQTIINDNKNFVKDEKENGNYTEETINSFNNFLTEASKYFDYYLDKENPVEDQEYWRYTKLSGTEYDELLDLVNSYKQCLMPVVDSAELQTQIDEKSPLLTAGIFKTNTDTGEQVQVKTMSSWLNMNSAVNQGKQDKIDTAGNAKYETLEPETIVLDNKEYTYAEPDINTLSADQITVNNSTAAIKATALKDCDASDRYASYDAVTDVVSAMERDRYTPEALAQFDAYVDQLSNGTDLTKPSVYVLATDEIAANYNQATGDNVAADTKLCATSTDETDPLTTALLEMLNGLEVNVYTAHFAIQKSDENDDAVNIVPNDEGYYTYTKDYGDMFSFDTGVDSDAVVTWVVQTFRKGDVEKYDAVDENGEKLYNDIKPVTVSKLSSFTGTEMLRKADCDIRVTAQINASENAATGVVLKVYNGYGNVSDVIYAADLNAAKAELVDPVMPFYSFKEWEVIDRGNNNYVAKPHFEATPTVTVTVSDGNTIEGKKLIGSSAESGTEVTVSTDNAQFYAWAVETADNKYQIVSYSSSYMFVAIADEHYTLITKVGDQYYADGTELTADKVDQFANTTNNGMNADEYLKLKLDSKAPFVYKQTDDLGGRKIFIRVTNGGNENDIRAYGVRIVNNDTGAEKKYPASKKAATGQFYMSLSEAAYAKYSQAPYQIQCFVTYSFNYDFNGTEYQINTTDYFNV